MQSSTTATVSSCCDISKVCKNIHQKIFIKNIPRDFFYYIGKKHHDDDLNQAYELSQSLSHQIIIFDIKPMAPLSN